MRVGFMMHSVLDGEDWDYSFLATSMIDLARLVADLRGRGFEFIFAKDWGRYRDNVVSLSFDDGYLDNWTILFPWMQENKVKFTIFVNKDFVEKSERIRDIYSRAPGYLNTAEIREMANSGWVDIQSHTCSHTWYPIGPKVIDIYNSTLKHKYPWVQWNNDIARKPDWLSFTDTTMDGVAVFENDRSLRAIRYIVDVNAMTEFNEHVIRDRLTPSEATDIFATRYSSGGHYESESERYQRYHNEIVGNMDFVESITGCRPIVLCWPGGAYNDLSESISSSLGLITTAKRGFGFDDKFVHRLSPTNHYGRDKWPWSNQGLTLSYYLARYRFKGVVHRIGKMVSAE